MYRTLGKLNVAFVIINVIGSIAGAIICWSHNLVWAGFVSLIAGILYSWFVYTILGTIAEIGENVEEIREDVKKHSFSLETLENAFKTQKSRPMVQKANDISKEPAPKEKENINGSGAAAPAIRNKPGAVTPIISKEPGKVICPQCGEVQRAGRSLCWNCKVPFAETGE